MISGFKTKLSKPILCVKVIVPCATLESKNCDKVFEITAMSLLYHSGGILAESALQNCFNIAVLEGFQT